MKSIITFALYLLLFSSCTQTNVYFTEAQPEGKKELKSMPKKFLGKYGAPSDSTLLVYFNDIYQDDENIDLKEVRQKIEITEKAILNKLKGQVKLNGDPNDKQWHDARSDKHFFDSLIFAQFHRPSYSYSLIEDKQESQLFQVDLCDTLFFLSEKNKLKDDYFLNIRSKNEGWMCFMINQKNNGTINFSEISKDDFKVLQRILIKNKETTENDIVQVSTQSFKEFIELGGFEENISLKKVD